MKHIAGDFLIDLASREVRGATGVQTLEPRAAAVLACLLDREGEVVSRSVLLDACWPGGAGSDEALSQTVAQLRRVLGDDPRHPRFIATVYKSGYRWQPQSGAIPAAAPALRMAAARSWATPPRLVMAGLLIAVFVGGLAGAGVFGLLSGVAPRRLLETSVDRELRRTVENGRLVERETVTVNKPRV